MGGTKKRHDTMTSGLRSSSLRLDRVSVTKTTQQTTNVGCMSGIFHFVSKYHTRRKFLTFGKKQEHETTKRQSQNSTSKCDNHSKVSTKLTLEMPRSPVIPSEIRRQSISSSNSPKSDSRMTETVAEKRRKLLGALEKCDEDLQALKRVIMSVRGVQSTPPLTPPRVAKGGVGKRSDEEEEEEMGSSEEPSPVSVLDCHQLLDRSPIVSYSKRTREDKSLLEHEQHSNTKKPWEENNATLRLQNESYASPLMVSNPLQSLYVPSNSRPRLSIVETTNLPATSRWSSATRESVIEVCKTVEFGQRHEVGIVVFVLQDIIFRELVDEIVKEFGCFHDYCSLPYLACKRKLSL